jgi:hypothetical protein
MITMRSREGYAVIKEWWTGHNRERSCREIMNRADLGANLWASQVDDSGGECWSHSLVKDVRPGDLREVAI